MTEKKLIDKRLGLAIRKWDTFVITRTLNGFLIAASDDPTLSRSIVTKEIADVQDYFETWARGKMRDCKDDDEEESDG